MLLTVLATHSAVAQEAPPTGKDLVRALERSKPDERTALNLQVGELSTKEKVKFVKYSVLVWQERGWRHLASGLAKVGNRSAAKILVRVIEASEIRKAKVERDHMAGEPVEIKDTKILPEAPPVEALGRIQPRLVLPLILPGWAGPEQRDPSRRDLYSRRELYQRILTSATIQHPGTALPILNTFLRGKTEEELAALDEQLKQLISEAFVQTRDLGSLASAVKAETARPAVAEGLLEGVHTRFESLHTTKILARQRRAAAKTKGGELEDLDDEHEVGYTVAVKQEREVCARLLASLVSRGETKRTLRAFRLLPTVLDELDDEWATILISAMLTAKTQDDWRSLRKQSYKALREVTGETISQSPGAWKRWWEKRQGTTK